MCVNRLETIDKRFFLFKPKIEIKANFLYFDIFLRTNNSDNVESNVALIRVFYQFDQFRTQYTIMSPFLDMFKSINQDLKKN